MKILVTGGAGFLGSHICRIALSHGHQVTSIDNRWAGVELIPAGVTDIRTDIRYTTYAGICAIAHEDRAFDAVIHCAARADIRQNWSTPGERLFIEAVNIGGTISLLEEFPATKWVLVSTGGVYGDQYGGIEDLSQIATSPYAASKLAGEAYVQAYCEPRGTEWYCIRPGCMVGAGYHHGHIADFVRMAMTGDKIIRATSDGRARRSFVHVEDVADACVSCVENPIVKGVYNVAGGEWSWRDTVQIMNMMSPSDEDLVVEYQHKAKGWEGDVAPVLSMAKAGKLFPTSRGVPRGVEEALKSLGWPK